MRSLSASIASRSLQGRRATDRRRCLAVDLRPRLGSFAAAERIAHFLHRGGVEVLVEIVIDLHYRRIHAATQALDLLDAEGLAVSRLLAGLHHGLRTAQPARRGGADLQEIFP